MTQADLSKAYDELPYNSRSYLSSQPSQLWSVGKLFGLDVIDYKHCRVLELGCASGGNIITAAAAYPESTFIGIDYSEKQIATGQSMIRDAGLTNIELKCLSIEDVRDDLGEFDYIIAHGLLSWVPSELQPVVFDICSNNLSASGLAYISFNAYPAWHFYEGLRKMMQYHLMPLKDKSQSHRSQQARSLVKFLAENSQADDRHYGHILKDEYELLTSQTLSYIAHDYLEENNHPFYFSDVIEMANKKGLQYLIDANLPSVFDGNFKPEAQKALSEQNLDLIAKEQYMDMLLNRRFRQVILCKKSFQVSRHVHTSAIKDMAFYTNIHTSTNDHDTATKYFLGEQEITIEGEIPKALNDILIAANGMAISFDDLLTQASFQVNESVQVVEPILLDNAVRMVFYGAWGLCAERGQFTTELSEKPEVCPVVRAMLKNNSWFNSRRYQSIQLQSFEAALIMYLDGSRSRTQLLEDSINDIRSGKLRLSKYGKSMASYEDIETEMKSVWDQVLSFCTQQAIMVA